MPVAKVTSKGQITLPKEVRDSIGISPGEEVEFQKEENGYLLKKKVRHSPFDRFVGYLKEKKGKSPDKIIDELRGK